MTRCMQDAESSVRAGAQRAEHFMGRSLVMKDEEDQIFGREHGLYISRELC